MCHAKLLYDSRTLGGTALGNRAQRVVAGPPQVWARAKHVRFTEGIAEVAVDLRNTYEPTHFPNLPTALAKATTEGEVERFLTNWGPLGWWQLLDYEEQARRPQRYHPGLLVSREPLDWIMAQAHTVDFALRLIEALQAGGAERLERVLLTRRITITEAETLHIEGDEGFPPSHYASYYLAIGGGYGGSGGRLADGTEYFGGWYQSRIYALEEGPQAREIHARGIVLDVVNANTQGMREQLALNRTREGLEVVVRARGLIELIWRHVRDAALGGELRTCEACGSPFLVTDDRQRFCPADLPGTKSRCAARAQKRRQRSR